MILIIPKDVPRPGSDYDYSGIGTVPRPECMSEAEVRVYEEIRGVVWVCCLPRDHPHAHIGWADGLMGSETLSFYWNDGDLEGTRGLPPEWNP